MGSTHNPLQNIDVPAYIAASWSNPINTFGAFRVYAKLRTEKWLRMYCRHLVANIFPETEQKLTSEQQECLDCYDETNRADLGTSLL